MGIVFGRFRKKPTTFEQLEKLDAQINSIEEYGKTTELTQKKVAGRFVLMSVFVYLVAALIFYFYFLPKTLYEGIIYIIPLITAPLVIVSVKRLLTWWYNRKLKRNRSKLSTLKEEKKKMLDKVMETETYKVAKKILETFAPDEVITRKSPISNSLALTKPTLPGSTLRYRGLTGTDGSMLGTFGKTPVPSTNLREQNPLGNTPASFLTPLRPKNIQGMSVPAGSTAISTIRKPMVRSILPRDRTAFDKLVDYLVGDGPSNRYALICKQCFSHNGMALREEFEYLSFYCCYCHFFNPAEKQKPPAPKLKSSKMSPPRVIKNNDDTSDSEKNSASDSGSDSISISSEPEDTKSALPVLNISNTLGNEDNHCDEPMEVCDNAEKNDEKIIQQD